MAFLFRVEDNFPATVFTYIKKSKLKGAGKGLFALKKIKKGEDVCQYIGWLVPMYLIESGFYTSEYLYLNENETTAIDASSEFSCYGRYANDSLSQMKINSKFSKSIVEHGSKITAIRDIKKNEEIYISYGVDYWKEPGRLSNLPQVDQDFITSGKLSDYLDSIRVELEGEVEYKEDEEDEDYEEKYDSDL